MDSCWISCFAAVPLIECISTILISGEVQDVHLREGEAIEFSGAVHGLYTDGMLSNIVGMVSFRSFKRIIDGSNYLLVETTTHDDL